MIFQKAEKQKIHRKVKVFIGATGRTFLKQKVGIAELNSKHRNISIGAKKIIIHYLLGSEEVKII